MLASALLWSALAAHVASMHAILGRNTDTWLTSRTTAITSIIISRTVCSRLVAMDGYEVATQIMLAGEGTSASRVRANEGLRTKRIMCCHMGLEIISPSEGSHALVASVFLARVFIRFALRLMRAHWLYGHLCHRVKTRHRTAVTA